MISHSLTFVVKQKKSSFPAKSWMKFFSQDSFFASYWLFLLNIFLKCSGDSSHSWSTLLRQFAPGWKSDLLFFFSQHARSYNSSYYAYHIPILLSPIHRGGLDFERNGNRVDLNGSLKARVRWRGWVSMHPNSPSFARTYHSKLCLDWIKISFSCRRPHQALICSDK